MHAMGVIIRLFVNLKLSLIVFIAVFATLSGGPAAAFTGNPKHDALAARTDLERRQMLHQVVSGQAAPCGSVSIAFHAGMDRQRNAYWDIRCTNGASFRSRLPPGRLAVVGLLPCGAAAPAPQGGPCFQPIGNFRPAAPRTSNAESACEAACTAQPRVGQGRCVARCIAGLGMAVGTAASLPTNSRFGAMYLSDAPLPAFGFTNGAASRLTANLAAARACNAMSGGAPCRFQGELLNQCGAVVMALSRHPAALVMTTDISTQVLHLSATGHGETQAAATDQALEACSRAQGAGIQCHLIAGGC